MKNFKKFLLGISLLAILVFGVTSLPGIKVSVSPTEIFGATNAIPTPIALFQTSLQSGITSVATSMTLVSGVDKDGNNLAGTYAFIIDEGTANEEFVNADCTATACTNMTRGLSVVTGTTSITALKHEHRRGASVKITDAPQLLILHRIVNGISTFPNKLSYTTTPILTAATDIATKGYVDASTASGCGNADTTSIGCVEIATQAEIDAGTQLGGTGAYLASNPATTRAKKYHDYAADSVGTDSYAITITPSISAYSVGQVFTFKAGTANTGTATLNVSTVGAVTIKKNNTSDLETGDILSGQIVQVVYDGTYMQMVSSSPLLPNTYAKTVDVQVYTADATYTKPAGAKVIEVIAIGAGGAGGSGGIKVNNGDQYSGATGGGGGAYVRKIFRASDISSTVAVTVAPQAVGQGVSSSFGSYLVAYGGGVGRNGNSSGANSSGGGGGGTGGAGDNGSNTTGTTGGIPASTVSVGGISGGGGGGTQGASGSGAEFGGAGGGGTATSSAGSLGGSSLFGGAGGGGGGGINGATPGAPANGAAGGTYGSYTAGSGGAGGSGAGSAGTAGTSRSGYGMGDGGGGGAGNGTGTGGAGGTGGAPGGGGGGGGSVAVGQTAGAGGEGGRGEVRVITYF